MAARRVEGATFDLAFSMLCLVWVGGAFLDTGAHVRFGEDLDPFFTPWHAVLYGGFGAVLLTFAGAVFLNRSWARSWRDAIPDGYGLAAVGLPLFVAGGLGDMAWHLTWGVEQSTEALVSPTHLLLASAVGLAVTGPVRAASLRRAGGWRGLFAGLLAFTLLLTIVTLLTHYAHPVVTTSNAAHHDVGPDGEHLILDATLGSIVLQAMIVTGFVLHAARRWALPPGAIALLVTLPVAGLAIAMDPLLLAGWGPPVAAAVVGGAAGDALHAWLKPGGDDATRTRWFAFALPAVLYASFEAALGFGGAGWPGSVHVLTGTVVLAGLGGLLVGLAATSSRDAS